MTVALSFVTLLTCEFAFSAETVPIWVAGAETETNAFYGFSAAFSVAKGEAPVLRVSAGSIARIWVNGAFVGYGPARSADGCMRIDEWPIDRFVRNGRNVVAIEVANASVNALYLPDRPAYLFAEIVTNGTTLVATGRDFKAKRLPKVQKTSRFSYQRGFGEYYRVTPGSYAWRTNGVEGVGLPLAEQPKMHVLDRGAPYPDFAFDGTFKPVFRTRMRRDPDMKPRRFCTCVEKAGMQRLKGYPKRELEMNMLDKVQHLALVGKTPCVREEAGFKLRDGDGVVFGCPAIVAGFPRIEVECLKPATVWLLTDELPGTDGLPDPIRFWNCINACVWDLQEPGRYSLECFEPNNLGSAHVIVEGGEVMLSGFDVRSYVNPNSKRSTFRSSDPGLDKVFTAAARTISHNAVDLPTDCPGRERGAYFGDTMFTGRGMDVLLGDNKLERSLFENYVLAPGFADVPEGMIPMCYPADVALSEEHWIPNFGMWAVIELEEYVWRSGDREMIGRFRRLAEGLHAWFLRYRNSDGLLEDLPGWVFLGWGMNERDFKNGVSYATNMTYVKFLEAFARLYGQDGILQDAERLKQMIREQSWNGTWFRDLALRQPDGSLKVDDLTSEGCQYYAFYSGVATREMHMDLWQRTIGQLGPRREKGVLPEVPPTNLLFGYCLRFDILTREGFGKLALEEVKACFLPMAERTGTLWEAMSTETGFSCDPGFTASAAWLILRNAVGLGRIDRIGKTVELNVPQNPPLEWCEATVPVSATETVTIKVSRVDGSPRVEAELPAGWTTSRREYEPTKR